MRLAYFLGGATLKTEPVKITRISRSEFRELAKADQRWKFARLREPQLDLAKLTKYVDGSVTVEPGAAPPDCQKCGVCCDLDAIIPMSIADSDRLGAYIEVFDDSETALVVDRLVTHDFSTGRCAHLTGTLGRDVGCGVYERRPNVCRQFEAGSDRCMEFRRMYGLEPQLDEAAAARFARMIDGGNVGVITNAVCVTDSVSFAIAASEHEPGTFVSEKKVTAKIYITVDGDAENSIELHSYDPEREVWLQSEFIGMTPEEARRLVAARGEQGASN